MHKKNKIHNCTLKSNNIIFPLLDKLARNATQEQTKDRGLQ